MRQPEFYAAVYGIIQDTQGRVLTVKRQNTGYLDGWYGLPAGHIEGDETLVKAMKREINEEVGLNVELSDMKFIHTSHRVDRDRIYFDFYFEIDSYSGIPSNTEPDKSEGIFWIYPSIEIQFQSKEILEKIARGETFSEIDFRP